MTAGQVAEEVFRMYYKFVPQSDSDLDIRDVLFHVYNGACQYAITDAQLNEKADEGYYADDQFYLTYTLPIQTDSRGRFYVPLPSAPVSLAGHRAIRNVFFPGSAVSAVFVSGTQRDYIGNLPKVPGIHWYRENSSIYFDKNGYAKLLQLVSFNIICAGSNPNAELNMPANYIPQLVASITKLLLGEKGIQADLTNDKTDN